MRRTQVEADAHDADDARLLIVMAEKLRRQLPTGVPMELAEKVQHCITALEETANSWTRRFRAQALYERAVDLLDECEGFRPVTPTRSIYR